MNNYNEFHRTYAEKLQSPLWQAKRLEVYQRDNFTCCSCNRDMIQLHNDVDSLQVHHLKYFPGLDPWEYELHYLVTYCKTCHETEHLIGDQIRGIFLELLQANTIYIRPLTQLNTLIENSPYFYNSLKEFLNNQMIDYLRYKTMKAA
jgi:hypothetical protein